MEAQETFFIKVYKIVKQIPKGKVITYKQVAKLAGNKNASRAVGSAMSKNPDMSSIPCHRVVGSEGKLHGYINGIEKKEELLQKEGVKMIKNKVNLSVFQWTVKN